MRSGRARAFVQRVESLLTNEGSPQCNNRGELCVVQALPPESELIRLGNSYNAIITGSGTLDSTFPPSPGNCLYNGEKPGGKSYIISSIGASLTVISLGAAAILSLVAELSTVNPINRGISANLTVGNSLIGKPRRSPHAVTGSTAAFNSPNTDWHRVGNSLVIANTSNALSTIQYNVYGRYIVPPRGLFSFALLSSVANATGPDLLLQWHEVQL